MRVLSTQQPFLLLSLNQRYLFLEQSSSSVASCTGLFRSDLESHITTPASATEGSSSCLQASQSLLVSGKLGNNKNVVRIENDTIGAPLV